MATMENAAAVAPKRVKRPGRTRKIFIHVVEYIVLAFFAFWSLIPIISCVNTAFKTPAEYNSTNVMTLPGSWGYFENFKTAWEKASMGKAF